MASAESVATDALTTTLRGRLERQCLALERIAAALERLAEPEPDDEQRSDEPDPEPPIDAWRPVKGGRAWISLPLEGPRHVVVDRIFESEGEPWATVVDEYGQGRVIRLGQLEPPTRDLL